MEDHREVPLDVAARALQTTLRSLPTGDAVVLEYSVEALPQDDRALVAVKRLEQLTWTILEARPSQVPLVATDHIVKVPAAHADTRVTAMPARDCDHTALAHRSG